MIPKNKVVLVTGDPRSGTSLMMQTLLKLGIDVAGNKFNDEIREKKVSEKIKEEMRDKNPGGFYEVPGVVMRGLKEIGEYGGKAIKVISPGAYPHGRIGTPVEIVHKYIFCLRNPQSVAVSQSKLRSNLEVAGDNDWETAQRIVDPTRFSIENGGLAAFIGKQDDEYKSLWLVVDYDEYLSNPRKTIDSIVNHLKITPSASQIEAAISNIDVSLKRSPKEFKGWDDKQQIGEIADDLYSAIKAFDFDSVDAVGVKIQEYAKMQQLERNRWYMREFGLIGDSSLYRRLKENETLRNNILKNYKRDLKKCLHPQVDSSFSETDEEYTIERAHDLGPITRHLVNYRGEKMTWEAAYAIAQRNYGKGAKRDADKLEGEILRWDL